MFQLDLPFSLTFYRWLLGQEQCLTLADLVHVSPDIHKTLRKMQEIVRKRDAILDDPELSTSEKNSEVFVNTYWVFLYFGILFGYFCGL